MKPVLKLKTYFQPRPQPVSLVYYLLTICGYNTFAEVMLEFNAKLSNPYVVKNTKNLKLHNCSVKSALGKCA